MTHLSILDSLPSGVILAGADGRVTFASADLTAMFGFSAGETTGRLVVEVLCPSLDQDGLAGLLRTAAAEPRVPALWNGSCRTSQHQEIHTAVRCTFEPDGGGQPAGFTITVFNITAAAAACSENEARYRELTEALPDAIFEIELDGGVKYLNRRATEHLGYSLADFPKGTSLLSVLYDEDQVRATTNLQKLVTGEYLKTENEYLIPTKDGHRVVPVLIRTSLIVREGRPVGFRGIVTDISDRKLANAAVQESRLWFNKAFHASPAPTAIARPDDGYCLDVNDRWLGLFEYTREEMIGRSLVDLWADAEARRHYVALAREHRSVRDFEATLRTKSGEFKPVLMSAELLNLRGEDCLMTVVQDMSGQRQVQTQELHSQKLEAIGQLAAGIAHEINTPIQFIGDNLRFIKESFGSLKVLIEQHSQLLAACRGNSVSPELLGRMESDFVGMDPEFIEREVPMAVGESLEGVGRVARIVSAMKDFGHPDSGDKTEADLNAAIESTVTVARHEWKYVAEVQLDLAPDLPRVSCLLGEFNQVILNLLVNAAHTIRDSLPERSTQKGRITITTRRSGDWVEVLVADTGMGVPENIRTRIFEPFFTTKPVGKGTGQGLAIARAVIEKKHGGSIGFESETGKGTTFLIKLPLTSH